jgi:hypothetical protein
MLMLLKNRHFRTALMTGSLLSSAMITGCSAHVGYRVYDPYYSDYHVWGPGERVYYNRWVAENHRENRDFRKLPKEDQHQYWTWRHSQPATPPPPR